MTCLFLFVSVAEGLQSSNGRDKKSEKSTGQFREAARRTGNRSETFTIAGIINHFDTTSMAM